MIRSSEWKPERIYSLRHMVTIMMIIINIIYHHFMWGIYHYTPETKHVSRV